MTASILLVAALVAILLGLARELHAINRALDFPALEPRHFAPPANVLHFGPPLVDYAAKRYGRPVWRRYA